MAESSWKRPPSPPAKKPRSEAKRISDRKRAKTRVNLGSAFHRWRQLLDSKEMQFDSELATFLLDWYEGPQTSTPMKKPVLPTDIGVSSISSSDSDNYRPPTKTGKEKVKDAQELARLECSLSEMSIGGEETVVDEGIINDWRNST
ncbi:hypothetical protein AALO_G00047570 [Alosa alosa]|uniref:Uncharacterized protein n=1 Tax=Alosa alosa TaxID=278164 RepID=A0AAV6H7R7_9TELE|nr:hypothetical protein AALO_G00047570 [Alosa alosa]